jgi:hypothetical protein
MPYKDPAKRREVSNAAAAKWRRNFKERDPEGFREYMREAQRRWAANLSEERREEIREYHAAYRRARGIPERQPAQERQPRAPREVPPRKPKRVAMTPEIFAASPDDPRHGTDNGYKNLRCRCDACRIANTASQAAYRARRADRDA